MTSPIAVASTPHFSAIASTRVEVRPASTISEHALLRLAGQDLVGLHRGLAQRHPLQVDAHAGAGRGGGLGERAGQAGAAEVLDADDQAGVVQLEAALDEQLLHERVADLHRRAALLGLPSSKVADGQHGDAADAVAAGLRADQHDDVADAGGGLAAAAVDRQHADAERVDQRVALVARVEDDLAADVGQAEAVAVAADAGDDAGQHPGGVRVVGGAEAQRVHHRDRAGAHGEDVADDAADAGGRALVGLDEARVVVRLDLEGDRELVADVDDAGVLADAGAASGRSSGPSRRTAAGAPCSTCRSSARST